jgi:hypothetical protein
VIQDDRTEQQPIDPDLPDGSLSDDLRSFLGNAPSEPKPTTPRTRQLRTSFRTTAFKSRTPDGRAAGTTLKPASSGPDGAPAPAARAKFFAGWRTSVQQAGPAGSTADKSAQPADAGAAGGRVRGRRAGSGKTKQAEAGGVEGATKVITRPLPIGVRVSITDPTHPWTGHSGEIISSPEKYGLGWYGQRIKLDGNTGESFVRPAQTNGTTVGGRGTAGAAPALPKAIAKLVPKSETSAPRVIVPTETERSSATRLFREIGETFNKNRKKSKTAAYAAFRHDLMANLDTLIMGGAIDLKEATTIITNLEQYTKETEAESTETPATILGRWLRMDAAEVAGLSVETVEEAVEDEEIESDDDTEESTANEDQLSG